MSLFLPEKYLHFFLTFIVFVICFYFNIAVFCCGRISFNLNGFTALHVLRPSTTGNPLTVALVFAIL